VHQDFQPCVYLLASKHNGTLYVGVTSNLAARIHQHRTGAVRGFTREYAVKQLVWFERHATMDSAITRNSRRIGGNACPRFQVPIRAP
jgi:putative endonuclease